MKHLGYRSHLFGPIYYSRRCICLGPEMVLNFRVMQILEGSEWVLTGSRALAVDLKHEMPCFANETRPSIGTTFGRNTKRGILYSTHLYQYLFQFYAREFVFVGRSQFMRTVTLVHRSEVHNGSNTITSHVIYEVKIDDDGKLYLKARIAPHGNKYRDKYGLKTDATRCPPVEIKWRLLSRFHISGSFCWRYAMMQ